MPKLTWDRLPICTICRCLAFESFLEHGRSNADLASTIAFDCCLTMLAIFTFVLPAITKMPAPMLLAIKKMLERVKSASQADQNQEDGGSSTVPWKRQHAPSSVLSLPADPLHSSVLQSKTPPPRPARPLSPCSVASLPPAQMRVDDGDLVIRNAVVRFEGRYTWSGMLGLNRDRTPCTYLHRVAWKSQVSTD